MKTALITGIFILTILGVYTLKASESVLESYKNNVNQQTDLYDWYIK